MRLIFKIFGAMLLATPFVIFLMYWRTPEIIPDISTKSYKNSHSGNQMNNAVGVVQSSLSIRKAATGLGIPRPTLGDRASGKIKPEGRAPFLPLEVATNLMGSAKQGFGVTKRRALKKTESIVRTVIVNTTPFKYATPEFEHINSEYTHSRTSQLAHLGLRYAVYSDTCQIRDMIPIGSEIARMISHLPPLVCDSGLLYFSLNSGKIQVKSELLRKHHPTITSCKYWPIRRKLVEASDKNFRYADASAFMPYGNDSTVVSIKQDDFLKIVCYDKKGGVKLTDFLHQIAPDKVKEVVSRHSKHSKDNKKDIERYNVVMFGIDSTSRLQAKRQLQKTTSYLEKELHAFDLHGYNRVGDNTFLNVVAMLMGKHVSKIGWNSKMTFDKFTFLWNLFEAQGYVTMYSEDSTDGAAFNYVKKGFLKQPAVHYLRHYMLALHNSDAFKKSRKKMGKSYCAGDRSLHKIALDYTNQFAETYEQANVPFFSFSFSTYISHDYLNDLGMTEGDHLEFVQRLHRTGVLNNTILIYFGDHGFRYGSFRATEQGRYEENLPYIQIVFPKSFRDKHPSKVRNLIVNKNRLTTPFDVYRTLCALGNLHCNQTSYGQSLLEEIPENRTCDSAGIPKEYCSCGSDFEVDSSFIYVQQAATAVIIHINNMTSSSNLCEVLKISRIKKAMIKSKHANDKGFNKYCKGSSCNNGVWPYLKTFTSFDMVVVLIATPGGGEFQANVIYNTRSEQYIIIGDISRLNLYGTQSICIKNDFNLRKFCLCKTH